MFWLKKFVSFWLMPLPLCLTMLVLGVVLLCLGKRVRLGRALVGVGTLLLMLFSNKVVSTWLVRPLEARYAAIPELKAAPAPTDSLYSCRFIVILGGGHSDTAAWSATNQLSTSALARMVEGVRLSRALPTARVVFSGPKVGDNPSHAAVVAHAAESLGLATARITLIDTARDTEDEAAEVRKMAGEERVALVTSAWHMPRSAALFRHAGVNVVPCPTDFTARINRDFRWNDLTWDTASLERSTWAVRERIGYLWVWLRQKA